MSVFFCRRPVTRLAESSFTAFMAVTGRKEGFTNAPIGATKQSGSSPITSSVVTDRTGSSEAASSAGSGQDNGSQPASSADSEQDNSS